MKRKKVNLLTPTVVTSFLVIVFVFLFLPKNQSPQSRKLSSNPSLPTQPPIPSTSFFSKLLKPKSSNLTTFVAVGDIMLGRYCNVQMLDKKDFKYPFLKTANFTSNADITFGNLEAPIVTDCPTTSTGMVFCAKPESVEGLKFGGFDVLSLANNHILNHGLKGLEETKKFLSQNTILYSPLSSPNFSSSSPSNQPVGITVRQVNNVNFGFLSFDLVTYPSPRFAGEAGQTPLISQISLISPTVDILIVSLHWGTEYQKTPTEMQKKLAHQIIDAGAKIIIGHHPHVTQPTEEYNGGLIFYSLGNFIFDQPWSEETKKGAIAKIFFEGKKIKSYEIVPTYIEDSCQPKLNPVK